MLLLMIIIWRSYESNKSTCVLLVKNFVKLERLVSSIKRNNKKIHPVTIHKPYLTLGRIKTGAIC